MRRSHLQTMLGVCAGVLMLGWCSLAHADLNEGDVATARARTALRERPGADYRVVTRVHPGDTLIVERTKGDWVKVKAGSQSGWVPLALLKPAEAAAAPPEAAPAHHGKSARAKPKAAFVTESKFTRNPPPAAPAAQAEPARVAPAAGVKPAADSKLPERRVAARSRTALKIEPSGGSRTVLIARAGEEMNVVEESDRGRWLLVDLDGEKGWVESKHVKTLSAEPAPEPVATTATVVTTVEPEAETTRRRGFAYSLGAGAGFVSLSQVFDSDATAVLGKYRISTPAGTVRVGGLLSYVTGVWELAVDGGYRFTAAEPGVLVQTTAGQKELAVIAHTIDLGARLGYRSEKSMGLGLYGRAGYHIHAVDIDKTMAAQLPSDTVAGLTIGGGLDVPHLSEHLGVDAHADLVVGASRDETIGLRDGAENGTSGVLLGTMISYRFGTAWAAQGGYQLQFLKTDFKGPSERLQSGTFATRSDTDHIVLLGLTYSR